MKNYVYRTWHLLMLLLVVTVWQDVAAQSAAEKRMQKLKEKQSLSEFETNDPFFELKNVPEKWKNRSAVILAERAELQCYSVFQPSVSGKIRRQIKLLDKAALEKFGTFEFEDGTSLRTAIRIHKPNGTFVDVDMKTAIGQPEQVRTAKFSLYPNYLFNKGKEEKKIALSGLEIGDVIDIISEYSNFILGGVMSPWCTEVIEVPFSYNYPVIAKEFLIKTIGGAITAIPVNGAPELKQMPKEKKKYVYLAKAEMLEDDTLEVPYTFKHHTQPYLKVQACWFPKWYQSPEVHGEDNGPIQQKIEDKQLNEAAYYALDRRINNDIQSIGKTTFYYYSKDLLAKAYAKKYRSWLNSVFEKDADLIKAADALYYKIRFDFFYGDYSEKVDLLNDEMFAGIMIATLREYDEKAKVFLAIAPSKSKTPRQYLTSMQEVYWMTCVEYKGKTKFYLPVDHHRVPEDQIWNLSGVEALLVPVQENSKPESQTSFKKATIPTSNSEENEEVHVMDIKMLENNLLSIENKTTAKGMSRLVYQDYYLSNMDFSKEELKWINKLQKGSGKEVPAQAASTARKRKQGEAVTAFDIKENERKQQQVIEERLSEKYKLNKYNGFEVTEAGRFSNKPVIEFSENYIIEEGITTAGNNLVFQAGLLIGKFDKLDLGAERKYPIVYDFPATNRWEFRFTVPAGYKVEGIESLNTEVSNASGRFKASAVLEGTVLKINVEQVYLNAELPASSWTDFVKFINAASEFNQKKVVLKKL